MSGRPRLINPTHQSAPDNYSSLPAFSFQRFAADNSQRHIRPRCSAPPRFGSLFSFFLFFFNHPVAEMLCHRCYGNLKLYPDRLKDEHILNEPTNEFCSFVAVFLFSSSSGSEQPHSRVALRCSVPPSPVKIIRSKTDSGDPKSHQSHQKQESVQTLAAHFDLL